MNPSQKTNLFPSKHSAWAILLGVLAIWSYFSFNNWIGDSEFWPISLANQWDNWKFQPALIYKPLFHFSLYWIYAFDLSSVEHIQVAKAFYTLLGAASFICLFAIFKKHLSLQKSLALVLILIFSNLGFSQIGLIRSDFLSFFLALFFFLHAPKIDSDKWLKLGFFSFTFSVLLFAVTPKSVFMSLLIFLFSFFHLNKNVRFRFCLVHGWSIILGYLILDQVIFDGKISWSSLNAISFYAKSYYAQSIQPFFNHNFVSYLKNDVVLWVALISGLVWQLVLLFKKKFISADHSWTAVGIATFLVLLLHKPMLPFFVGSYWGFLFLGLIPILKKIEVKYLTALLIVTLGVFSVRISPNYFYPNSVQLQTIEEIESLVKSIPQGRLFDGLGVAPRSPQHLFYVGPDDDQSNSLTLKWVKEQRPEVVVYSARLKLIEPEIGDYLRAEYQTIGMGYWLRKDLETTKKMSHLKPAFFIFGYYPVPENL